ncbi:MAG: hypothetical protein AAF411_24305 [Myxococcota bacterium]
MRVVPLLLTLLSGCGMVWLDEPYDERETFDAPPIHPLDGALAADFAPGDTALPDAARLDAGRLDSASSDAPDGSPDAQAESGADIGSDATDAGDLVVDGGSPVRMVSFNEQVNVQAASQLGDAVHFCGAALIDGEVRAGAFHVGDEAAPTLFAIEASMNSECRAMGALEGVERTSIAVGRMGSTNSQGFIVEVRNDDAVLYTVPRTDTLDAIAAGADKTLVAGTAQSGVRMFWSRADTASGLINTWDVGLEQDVERVGGLIVEDNVAYVVGSLAGGEDFALRVELNDRPMVSWLCQIVGMDGVPPVLSANEKGLLLSSGAMDVALSRDEGRVVSANETMLGGLAANWVATSGAGELRISHLRSNFGVPAAPGAFNAYFWPSGRGRSAPLRPMLANPRNVLMGRVAARTELQLVPMGGAMDCGTIFPGEATVSAAEVECEPLEVVFSQSANISLERYADAAVREGEVMDGCAVGAP